MSGDSQGSNTLELNLAGASTAIRLDDPEAIIEEVERSAPKACPELRALPVELRVALEAILHVQSKTVQFTTTTYPYGRLWIWADDSIRMRLTSVRWNADFPISFSLDNSSVRRIAKALKTMGGTMGRYADPNGLTIDEITIPWAKGVRTDPPDCSGGNEPFFQLDREEFRKLKSSKLVTLVRDFPERILRILPETGEPALHPASFNSWPPEDLESQFAVPDVGLLVGRDKSPVNVYCDHSDASGRLLLTSSTKIYEEPEISVRTTITGTACPHPLRYVREPAAYELEGLDDEPDESGHTASVEPERTPFDNKQPEDEGIRSSSSYELPMAAQHGLPKATGKAEILSDVGGHPTNDKLATVGSDSASDEIGFTQLLALADVGTPDDDASCDELVQHVKLLAEVLGALELTFNIKMAKLLLRAKRAYTGKAKFEDYAALALDCSTRTICRFVQIGREISETDYGRIPPPFRKLQYLTTIASALKKGENLVDIVEQLETDLEGESSSEGASPPVLTGGHETNGGNDPTDPAKNAGSEPEPVEQPPEPNPKPRPPTDRPAIRSARAFMGEPLRLASRKGSVTVTITRIEVSRSIVQRTLESIDGDTVVLGGFTAFVDVDLITK